MQIQESKCHACGGMAETELELGERSMGVNYEESRYFLPHDRLQYSLVDVIGIGNISFCHRCVTMIDDTINGTILSIRHKNSLIKVVEV